MSECLFRTVAGEATAELEEKRSTFLAVVRRVEKKEDVEAFVKERRKAHPDARHTVFAYLLKSGTAGYSDDAEPQGTAGMPILEVIKRTGLTDVAVVVTRYFGGILLGAGGLTRAYAGAAAEVLHAASVMEYAEFTEFSLTVSYADYPKLQKEFERLAVRVRSVEYEADVRLTAAVSRGGEENFIARVADLTAGRAAVDALGTVIDVL